MCGRTYARQGAWATPQQVRGPFGLDVEKMSPRARIAVGLSVLGLVAVSGVFLALTPVWWIFTTYFWAAFPALGVLGCRSGGGGGCWRAFGFGAGRGLRGLPCADPGLVDLHDVLLGSVSSPGVVGERYRGFQGGRSNSSLRRSQGAGAVGGAQGSRRGHARRGRRRDLVDGGRGRAEAQNTGRRRTSSGSGTGRRYLLRVVGYRRPNRWCEVSAGVTDTGVPVADSVRSRNRILILATVATIFSVLH